MGIDRAHRESVEATLVDETPFAHSMFDERLKGLIDEPGELNVKKLKFEDMTI